MNQSKHAFPLLALPLLILISLSAAVAQSDPEQQLEPSYEITLHVVIGSNEPTSKTDVPANMSAISKYLKGNFSFTNYRLANTFFGRITNNGNIEYKSVSNILGQETDAESQTFLEWTMGNIRTTPHGFQARPFRFGARIPVRMGGTKDGAGGVTPIVAYEPVGLTVGSINFPVNTPTLVGTISLPKTTGTVFLVATVRPVEL